MNLNIGNTAGGVSTQTQIKNFAVRISVRFWQLICDLASRFVNRCKRWYHAYYRPDQETSITLSRLTNHELKGLGGYFHWSAGVNELAMMMWLAVLFMITMAAIGVCRKPETWHVYATLLLFPAEFIFLIYVGIRDNRHKCLRRFLPHVWHHPEIREARQQYRYFFINEKENGTIVFTNVRPFHLLCAHPRERTDVDWAKYRDNPAMKALDWALMSTIYLRFIWPFILSPMQLAFLGYRTAMKHGDFQPGQRVLCIGSGPLPYHCWWKKKLGEHGEIVALDLDPYVNKTSLRVNGRTRRKDAAGGVNQKRLVHRDRLILE